MRFRAASVKTMFSQSITQILLFCDNRCVFLMPTKQFYFHWKRAEAILRTLDKIHQNPPNLGGKKKFPLDLRLKFIRGAKKQSTYVL